MQMRRTVARLKGKTMRTFTIMFETEEYDSKDEAVYAILQAIQNYEETHDPRPIRWVGDDLVSESDD